MAAMTEAPRRRTGRLPRQWEARFKEFHGRRATAHSSPMMWVAGAQRGKQITTEGILENLRGIRPKTLQRYLDELVAAGLLRYDEHRLSWELGDEAWCDDDRPLPWGGRPPR